jgi:transketolase
MNLSKQANEYRRELFEKFVQVGQGHPGSTFSMLELVTTMYHGGFVRFDQTRNQFIDKVIISKGHATVALYPILKKFGVISGSDWSNWGTSKPSCLRVFGNTSIPGIDATSGSLGHGVGIGSGLALAYKQSKRDKRVYVVISEGELYEGSTWEALLFATHNKLENLTIFIDINNLIILGKTDDCLKLNSIRDKLSGWPLDMLEIDGHNTNAIYSALEQLQNKGVGKPKIILANTVKGKGFSIMENCPEWHYMQPMTVEQVEQCRKELNDAAA